MRLNYKNMTAKIKIFLEILLYYTITIIILPTTLLLLLILYLYKSYIFLLIYKKHNPSDITKLRSEDTIWALGEFHHNTADILMILNLKTGKSEFVRDIKNSFLQKIIKFPDVYPKMTSVIKHFRGYNYLLQTDITIDDCVTVIEAEDERSLMEILAFYANRQLPMDNTLLWEVVVLSGSSRWKRREGLKENQLPVLFRYNHIIGDGLSMINLLAYNFITNDIDCNLILNKFNKNTPKNKKSAAISRILLEVHVFLMTFSFMMIEKLTSNLGVWKSPKVVHKRHLAFANETDAVLVDKIKNMKNKIGHTTFSDILLTGISASLEEYFRKALPEVPQYVLITVIAVGILLELNRPDGLPDLQNQVTFSNLKLPTSVQSQHLGKRLREVQKKTKNISYRPDPLIHYFVLSHITGLIPEQILKKLVCMKSLTATVSNIPEMPRFSIWNGNLVDSAYFFTPLRDYIGMGFTILNYDNKLHIGLSFDEATIPTKEEGQKIVNGILETLMSIKDEVFTIKLM